MLISPLFHSCKSPQMGLLISWYINHLFYVSFDSSTIREKIIPHAVSWFTGEAVEYEDIDVEAEDEADEEDDEDGSEEDDDEVEEKDDNENKVRNIYSHWYIYLYILYTTDLTAYVFLLAEGLRRFRWGREAGWLRHWFQATAVWYWMECKRWRHVLLHLCSFLLKLFW